MAKIPLNVKTPPKLQEELAKFVKKVPGGMTGITEQALRDWLAKRLGAPEPTELDAILAGVSALGRMERDAPEQALYEVVQKAVEAFIPEDLRKFLDTKDAE